MSSSETGQKLKGEAEKLIDTIEQNVDTEKLKAKFDMSHFDLNAVFRGMQLTMVAAHKALQNPALFTSDHYRQAAIAVAVGIAIRLIVAIPLIAVRVGVKMLSLFMDLDSVTWDDSLVEALDLVGNYVLQVPFFLMTLMRHFIPTLDNLFMQSVQWADQTYLQKHKGESPDTLRELYYPHLSMYGAKDGKTRSGTKSLTTFLYRFARKGAISLTVFALSYTPIIGPLVLPAASFYTFNSAVGLGPASVIFGTGIFLPRKYLIIFLQSYFSSRSLMRELLDPYFSRIRFTKEQKKNWFRSREGVLFGFGLAFYMLVNIPLVGVLVFGVAEASTAYLITKITDPPPSPESVDEYAANQQVWSNKHEFLNISLSELDASHRNATSDKGQSS